LDKLVLGNFALQNYPFIYINFLIKISPQNV